MKKFFITIFFLIFSCQFSFAADRGDFQLQRQITIGDGKNAYGKKVYGQGARAVMENVPIKGSTSLSVEQLIKRSIAADKPTALKVGGSMLKRLNSPQAIVGTAVVGALLTAIGWVMEDGKYVKKVDPDSNIPANEDPTIPYIFATGGGQNSDYIYSSAEAAGRAMCAFYNESYNSIYWWSNPTNHAQSDVSYVWCVKKDGARDNWDVRGKPNPIYNPNATPSPDLKPKIVPLTAALLGAAMVGSQYLDPDPKFDNTRVNTGDYTGVKDIYEHDPSGVGDELADAMDDKLRNAKPTGDGSPSFVGDPKYDNGSLGNDRDDTSDRSWNEKGGAATGGSEPEKDPITGQPTGNQSITLTFPLFCSWASKMCLWYDDWKASDKVYKDHMTKTEEHQTEEKTFWTSVKDWFDWTKKEDDLPEKDDSEINLDDQLIIDAKTKNISWSAQCPTAQTVPINFHGVTAEITVADFSYLCSLDWLIKPFVLAFASISAAFIVFGFNRGGDDG